MIRDCEEDMSKGVPRSEWTTELLYTADVTIYDDNGIEVDKAINVASTYPNSTNGFKPIPANTKSNPILRQTRFSTFLPLI